MSDLPQGQVRLLQERAQLLEKKLELQEKLPHLYGWKWYPWAWEFFKSTDRYCFLVAANQISKSSSQIRKCIEWAGNPDIWPALWRTRPRQFWYLYPSKEVALVEFESKWVPEFLPRDKEHPTYGWHFDKKRLALYFNSGVVVYFKSYMTDVSNLQTASAHAIWCFAAGTKVATPDGDRNIEEIAVGDMVYGGSGVPRKVLALPSRGVSEVAVTVLSNGQVVKCTLDHKFLTEELQWEELYKLNSITNLATARVTGYQSQLNTLGCHSEDIQSIEIEDKDISKQELGDIRTATFTRLFGNLRLAKYLKGMSCTIKMVILQIMNLVIWNLLQEQTILENTNLKNGLLDVLENYRTRPVLNVRKSSPPGLLRKQLLSFALKSADVGVVQLLKSVIIAVKIFVLEKTIKKRIFVVGNALALPQERVYCLNVEEDHSFQVCGIIAKNCDEELPFGLFSEINMRIAGVAGYFSMVFTATLGQEEWRRTMEDIGKKTEMFVHAWKKCVSMYECMYYTDGTKSHWTEAKIKEIESTLTPLEILRRVRGRFVVAEGLQYPTFRAAYYPEGNYYEETKWALPKDWLVYIGVDIGGGGSSHPPAITFLGVDPRYTKARAFMTWRGFPSTVYTVEDIYKQLRNLVEQYELNQRHFEVRYDWASKDFGTVAGRDGFPVFPADKTRDSGKMVLNSLFKSMALLCSDELSGPVLYEEIRSLTEDASKTTAKDDAIDSLRYAATSVPWAWDAIMKDATKEKPKAPQAEYKPKYRGDDGSGAELFLSDSINDEIGDLNGFAEF